MTPPTPATPPQHTEYLAKQLALWRDHLRSQDKALRLEALRAIAEYVDALITQEYGTARPKATAQALSPLRRLLAHVRRVL